MPMKPLVVAAFACLVVLPAATAGADTPPRAAPQAASTTRTADYVARDLGGDAVIAFTGDELVGPTGGAYGDVIRRPPGVVRVGLIRPRLNFVSELLKSVENL